MRLFLAIYPTNTITSEFRETIAFLKKFKDAFRFVAIDQIHLTVKFLGDVVSKESETELIKRLIPTFRSQKSFKIRINKVQLGFSHERYPKILLCEVNESKYLNDLVNRVQVEIKKLNLDDIVAKSENKKFRAHFTLARLKRRISTKDMVNLQKLINSYKIISELEFKVENVYLMESELTKNGPIYKRRFEFALK